MFSDEITIYKRTKVPYVFRVLAAWLHPGLLLLLALAAVFMFLAFRTPGSLGIGLALGAGLIIVLILVICIQSARNKIILITRIGIAKESLVVESMYYNETRRVEITGKNLNLDLLTFRPRRGSTRYSLLIRDNEHDTSDFKLYGSFSGLAALLSKMEDYGLTTLRAKEKKAVDDWKTGERWEKSILGKLVRYSVPLLVLAIVIYQAQRIKEGIEFWFNQKAISNEGVRQSKSQDSLLTYAASQRALLGLALPARHSVNLPSTTTAILDRVMAAREDFLAYAFHINTDESSRIYLSYWPAQRQTPKLILVDSINFPESCDLSNYAGMIRATSHKGIGNERSERITNSYYHLDADGFRKKTNISEERLNRWPLSFTLLGDSASFSYRMDEETGTHLIAEIFIGDSFYCNLPPHVAASLALSEITSVQSVDINHDQRTDLIVTGAFMSGAGPTGAETQQWTSVYFQNQYGRFVRSTEIDTEMNRLEPGLRTPSAIESLQADYTFLRSPDKASHR